MEGQERQNRVLEIEAIKVFDVQRNLSYHICEAIPRAIKLIETVWLISKCYLEVFANSCQHSLDPRCTKGTMMTEKITRLCSELGKRM